MQIIDEALSTIHNLCDLHGCGWLNLCTYDAPVPQAFAFKNWLGFSRSLLFYADYDCIVRVAAHEIGHIIDGFDALKAGREKNESHGANWKGRADWIGARTDEPHGYPGIFVRELEHFYSNPQLKTDTDIFIGEIVEKLDSLTEQGCERQIKHFFMPAKPEPLPIAKPQPSTSQNPNDLQMRFSLQKDGSKKFEMRHADGSWRALPEDRSKWPEKLRRAQEISEEVDRRRTYHGRLVSNFHIPD